MKVNALRLVFPVFAIGLAATGIARADDDTNPRYTIEDVTACSPDAMRLCKDKLGDIDAIEDCMKAHFNELRPKCQARFKR